MNASPELARPVPFNTDIRTTLSLILLGITLLGVLLIVGIMLGAHVVRRAARRPQRASRIGADDWAAKPLVNDDLGIPDEPAAEGPSKPDDR